MHCGELQMHCAALQIHCGELQMHCGALQIHCAALQMVCFYSGCIHIAGNGLFYNLIQTYDLKL